MTLAPADTAFRDRLRADLPDAVFRPAAQRYLEEPRGLWRGEAGLLALPRDTGEVATLIRHAAEAGVGVVPYGGGTGLVGGQLATGGPPPLVISMERMTAVRALHADEYTLTVEAGAILADVQAAARAADRLFPLSLAAEGSARIGGVLSTNAGGTGVLRYGNARDLCLGIEAVLPDGTTLQGLTRLRKDNTGYDLRNLLIGAEGTLGLITAATLKLFSRPAAMGTALIYVPSPGAALDLLSLARDRAGEMVSAFELMHRQGFDFLAEKMPETRQPFATPPEWCVLVELGLSGGLDPQAALEGLFEAAVAADLAEDGLIAQNETQAQDFWQLRERIPEANRLIGAVASHDISLPLGAVPDFIARAGPAIAALGDLRVNCFGHLGDGNLHYNVFPARGVARAEVAHLYDAVRDCVHDLVHEMQGSISAEHGIGRAKVADLERYGDPVKLATMRAIKAALDPGGIMNPGAVLRR